MRWCLCPCIIVYITFDDCNCKLRVKEQYKLKNHVTVHTENHLLKSDFGGSFSGFASRSLAAWPALARRFGRIIRAIRPTYTVGININRPIQTYKENGSAEARKRFVNTSWVDIVLAGGSSFVSIVNRDGHADVAPCAYIMREYAGSCAYVHIQNGSK